MGAVRIPKDAYYGPQTQRAEENFPVSGLKFPAVFIDSLGVVYPCSIYDRPLGKLREHDYDLGRVLHADEARRARTAVIEDTCPGCWTPCEAYQSLFAHFTRSDRREARGWVLGAKSRVETARTGNRPE